MTGAARQTLGGDEEHADERGESEILVQWKGRDPENPLNWSKTRKWVMTVSASAISGLSASIAGVIPLGYPSMKAELRCSDLQATATLALYPFGFSIAPLVLAPLSEEWGRRPIYLGSMIMFTLFFLPIALAQNVQTVMISRFLQGAFASTGSAMVGGTIGDFWDTSERGHPMALFSFAVIGTCGIAPAVAGIIEQNLGWRWIQWIGMIFSGVFFIWLVMFGAPETRGAILLARRAKKLRKTTGDSRYHTAVDPPNLRQLIWISTTRPLYLLFTEPIVASFSLWLGFAWGLVYGFLESIALTFNELYNFDSEEVGLAYLSITVGTAVGLLLNIHQEKLYRDNYPRVGVEARLYSACVAGITFSLGAFIYAWTSYPQTPWMAPCVGIVIIVASLFAIYQAVFNYLADSYMLYASSALAGQSLSRNLMGAAYPLFTAPLYHNLTFRWGGTLIGCIGALLAPIPFVLFWFGPKIRARSRFASGLIHTVMAGAGDDNDGDRGDGAASDMKEKEKTQSSKVEGEIAVGITSSSGHAFGKRNRS